MESSFVIVVEQIRLTGEIAPLKLARLGLIRLLIKLESFVRAIKSA
jgi:hypothetical protein